ncbi:MAG: HU family DNA-binding protein [Bacteroidota bacterium]
MAVNFKAVPKKNPSKQDDPPKYYAQVVSSGEMSMRQVAKQISAISTVSTTDTVAVIEAFLEVVPQTLADGKIVRLGDFGSFSLTLSSEGVADAASLGAKDITRVNVKFRPGKEFAKVIDTIEFTKTV